MYEHKQRSHYSTVHPYKHTRVVLHTYKKMQFISTIWATGYGQQHNLSSMYDVEMIKEQTRHNDKRVPCCMYFWVNQASHSLILTSVGSVFHFSVCFIWLVQPLRKPPTN